MRALQSTQEKRAMQRKRIGRIMPANGGPRVDDHKRVRNCCLGTKIDRLINEAFIAEAARRGIPKSELLGRLVEVIVDDLLFDAVLDEGV